MKSFNHYLVEDFEFTGDVFSGFEYIQKSASEKARIEFRVTSDDRETDRDEILRRLKNAGVSAEKRETSASSVDPIYGEHEGRKFVILVKPKKGGMGESTLNSSITELFPCIMFERQIKPTGTSEGDIDKLMERLLSVDTRKLKCVGDKDQAAAKTTLQRADTSSKYFEKMKAAISIYNYLIDENKDKPIRKVYWGYRAKPKGVPQNHPGDMFIEYEDGKMIGVSLKSGGKKTKEPQLNTYHYTVFVNDRGGPAFNDAKGKEALRKKTYDKVYSKIPDFPKYGNHDGGKGGRHPDKTKAVAAINKLPTKEQNKLYDEYLEIARQGLIERFNRNKNATLKYIKEAILRDAPDVPTIVIKAIEKTATYEQITDKDELGVFLPQVRFVKAYASQRSKQNWFIELKSGDDMITLTMSVRSSSGGKLKQWNLKTTYNGLTVGK